MRGSVLFVTYFFFVLSPLLAKKKPRTGKEALFGKEYATYQITSNELSGACFYLVTVMSWQTVNVKLAWEILFP